MENRALHQLLKSINAKVAFLYSLKMSENHRFSGGIEMQHSLTPINATLNTNANDLNNFSIQRKQESIMKIQKPCINLQASSKKKPIINQNKLFCLNESYQKSEE